MRSSQGDERIEEFGQDDRTIGEFLDGLADLSPDVRKEIMQKIEDNEKERLGDLMEAEPK